MEIGLPLTALPLAQAIEAYGDPELRNVWLEHDKRAIGGYGRRVIAEKAFWSNYDRSEHMRGGLLHVVLRARAEDAYVKAFWNKVVGGDFLVWGRATPAAPMVLLDAALRYLTPHFDKDIARDDSGFTVYDIRIAPKEIAHVGAREVGQHVSQASIVSAIQQRIANWREGDQPKPLKMEVYKSICASLGKVSMRQFVQHWAVLAPKDWKRAGAPRRPRNLRTGKR